ncbi:hypothetical protein AAHC03_026831 [Spirometra sp. Aus1]
MKLLAERLMSDGRDLLIEPHVPEGNSFCKPDIVMSTENSITVIDVAVAGEDIMDRVYAGKDRRYSAEEVEVNLRRILTKPANTPVSHIPAVFSARGTISSRSESLLRSLGLSTFDLSDLCLAVIRGSLKAYDVYARGAGGVADNRREGTREPYEAGVARAPPLITTLLSSSYSRTSTYILDAEVRCQRDVRQGNPLSPLLFNCALSEALSYSDRQLGFDLAGATVDSIAYADDLVLFAESPHSLQQRLDGLANGLSLAGMVLNSAKCVSFYVQALGKEKSACLCPCEVSIRRSVLRSLGPSNTFKYLRVPFSYRGRVTVGHRSVLSDMLDEITRAPLKPQQRIALLKRHCVPKLLHELVLGTAHRNTLKRLDTQVRQSVRRWLKLPADTPVSFLHVPVADGGLGVPCLTVLVLFAKRRRLDSVLSSTEPVVRAAATVPSALPGLRLSAQPVRMGHSVLASKEDARNYWRTVLYNSADGRPLAQFAKSACASHGLSSPVRVFPWLYLRG